MKAKPPAKRAHHLLKFIWVTCRNENISLAELCRKAGVSYNTMKEAMQGKSNISVASLEAALNVLGYSIKPVVL